MNALSGVITLSVSENQANVAFIINIGVIHNEKIEKLTNINYFLIAFNSIYLLSFNLSKKYSSQAFIFINLIY